MRKPIYNRDTDPRYGGAPRPRDKGEFDLRDRPTATRLQRPATDRGPALPPIYVLTRYDVFVMCFWAAFMNTIVWIIISLLLCMFAGTYFSHKLREDVVGAGQRLHNAVQYEPVVRSADIDAKITDIRIVFAEEK